MTPPGALDAMRVVAELRALDARSGGRRVAWTEPWERERARLSADLNELPGVSVDRDEAGNLWARLPGVSDETIVVGSHLDSVPEGGWLDGALGVLAGLQLMREVARGPRPARSLALVDWADEEGARFGRSLFGSSAAAGLLSVDAVSALRDAEGNSLAETLGAHGVDVRRVALAGGRLRGVSAYLELHIEQGPVLEDEGRRCAAVCGALGTRRTRLRIVGTSVHAGAPMSIRCDAGLVGAEVVLAARRAAQRGSGRATVGTYELHPGVATIVPGICELVIDLRHQSSTELAELERAVLDEAATLAASERCELTSERLFASEPVSFDPDLVRRLAAAADPGEPLVSGALHDAVAIAQAGVPTAMMFVRSRGGVSHSRQEDSAEADLLVALDGFAQVVEDLIGAQAPSDPPGPPDPQARSPS
jgi:hydantoinase/carbamoylase family amidase